MQQPQSRPLLGDSVSSTTSPTTRRNSNPVAVLTQQQLQQLQQLQSQNSGSQSVTFTLQQSSGNSQEQPNGSTAGNHILYVNQLNQLNQGPLNPSGTGMGLPPATPTFGVGLNMGLPLSLLNTNLSSLTSNAITTSNPLLNLSLPNINSGLTAINPSINQLSALGTNINSNLPSDSISNGLSNLGQDLTGMNSSINRINTLNSTSISSGLSNINTGLTNVNPNLTNLNTTAINQNLATINANINAANSGATSLNTLSQNINLNQQGLNRSLNAINFSSANSNAQFPFQTIQSIQSIAPHIVGSSIANVVSSAISQNQNSNITSTVQSTNIGSSSVTSTYTSSGPILATTTNAAHGSNNNQQINVAQFGIMSSNMPNIVTSQVSTNESDPNSSINAGYQRQFANQNLNQSTNVNQATNSIIPNIKTMQGIQNQSSSSPSSPFSIPMKSPASNIAPPTPSPSPNRLLLRSPASNSMQARNSPSPVSIATSNANFGMQLQSPLQSPINVGQIQSPVPSPYPPAKSPHHLNTGATLSNKSPAPGSSPGPPVVRPNTPILQQGMQVLQIIGTPQGYQQAPQLVTRTHLFGNQQIQIAAAAKPSKQPPQILPKPPLQQANMGQQKQRATTTITNQVTQQSQPQLVLAGPQPNPPTATMIPTAQGLLLNQLTQQQLVRVVTAQGMQLQGIAPTFFAVPNGFPSPAPPIIRHTSSSPAPANTGNNSSIVIQNAMVQNSQPQIAQTTSINSSGNIQNAQTLIDQSLLPPPKKKAKKKKKPKKKDEEPPKLDLASIMKISGIGDDDDMFDSDLTTEAETPHPQVEVNPIQNSPLVTMQNTPVQQNLVSVPISSTSNILQATPPTQENLNSSNTVTHLQAPTQNAISGQLRLAVGEDGRVVLHHTPDPNQPEIDQATAQALIRSLTQAGGQNSQIISQLLQAQLQTPQNSANNRQKFVKSPVPNVLTTGSPLTSPSNLQGTNVINPQQIHINSNPNNLQTFNVTGVAQTNQSVLPMQASPQITNIQTAPNAASQNLNQSTKNIVISRKVFDAKKQTVVDVKSSQKTNVQTVRPSGSNQLITINQQQSTHVQQTKCNQTKARNTCINTNQQQNLNKQVNQVQMQKPVQSCTTVQRNVQLVKNNQNQLQQISIQEDGTFVPQNSMLYQQNMAQQVSTSQTVQTQNVQQIFEQNLQQNIGTTLQRTSADGVKIESINVVQQSTAGNLQQPQQQTVNLLQQNVGSGIQSIEHNLQFANDVHFTQQQNIQTNASNLRQQQQQQQQQQQKIKQINMNSTNNQQFELQNLPASILISNSPCPSQQQEQQKLETQNVCNMNSPAASIFNSAPKITPEILNALSNLNPNDQLLIANANGQMQVISQQLLQQFLSGQFNTQPQAQTPNQPQAHTQPPTQAQPQHQNQTQKIVIGDPDLNNSNMQEVQINTPTSQIIVNSSGGAPTIQNNIQNIVVQAAPTQMPQQIQIQNSGFPSQFIDNLNQQQIRNLGNNAPMAQSTNQNANHSCAPKKPKLVKRTKVLTVTQQTGKSVGVSRAVIVTTASVTTTSTTTTTSSISPQHKVDSSNKMLNVLAQVVDGNKNESPQIVTVNGPLTSLSPSCQVPILSTGQVVQRVQTIQLTSQKQQLLSSNQAQIRTILARKPNSPAEQVVLNKLYQEQARILASGKIISTSHPINSESETTISLNVVSSTTSGNIVQTTCKSQTSTAQTQTSVSTPIATVAPNSQNIHLATSPANSIYLPAITQAQPIQSPQTTPLLKQQQQQQQQQQQHQPQQHHHLHHHHQQQQQQHEVHVEDDNNIDSSQVLVPSSLSTESFSSPKAILETQQSTQCQNDPVDVKPNITAISTSIKQEQISSVPLQTQNASPAGQVMSPRMAGKLPQSSQNKLLSPDNPSASPRQGVKRTSSSSPVCRQVNRTELFEQQLKIDQNGATNPDVNTPFQSKRDACKRLVRYHCFNEQVLSTKDLEKADEIFEETAKHLLSKFNSMMNKYTYLLIMESMRETRTSELMMIDRMIVNEEQATLNRLREQEAKLSVSKEESKVEEKLLVPKIEPEPELESETAVAGAVPGMTSTPDLSGAPVKLELEMEVGMSKYEKSAEYDEWLEIQKELGVYSGPELNLNTGKCRSKHSSGRTRANGEVSANTSSLERDLLEDSESLDGLALYTQNQPSELRTKPEEQDNITAQVQSAIDSILSLKKRPATQPASVAGQSNESSDKLLDQAVRSILGS